MVFLKSGAVSQLTKQLCICVSKRQDLLRAFTVLMLQEAAPLEIHEQQRNAGRIPYANVYQAREGKLMQDLPGEDFSFSLGLLSLCHKFFH